MTTVQKAPCQQRGLAPEGPFPCLEPAWGARPCPMNAGAADELRERLAASLRHGFPFAAWVVRLDALGLHPCCSLTFFRKEPNPVALAAVHGRRFLHLAPAVACAGESLPPAG